MVEDKKKEKEEAKRDFLVVVELPKQQVASATLADGKEYDLIPVEEALTEMLKTIRELKKGLL